MTPESGVLELLGAGAASAISTAAGMYRLFVPRGEASTYRESLAEEKRRTEKRLDNVEFFLSRAVTRETLNDVIDPVRADLSEIKKILRERDSHGKVSRS